MGDPAPGLVGVHLQPDDDVAGERLAHPRQQDTAATERDRAAVSPLQQLADDLGLAFRNAVSPSSRKASSIGFPSACSIRSSISVVSSPASRAEASAVLFPAPMKPMK